MLLRAHVRPFDPAAPPLGLRRASIRPPVYVATVLAFLVIRLDVFLVNGYLGNEQAGSTRSLRLRRDMYLLPTVVGLNLFPRVARGAPFEYTASVFRIMAVLYGGLCLITSPSSPRHSARSSGPSSPTR